MGKLKALKKDSELISIIVPVYNCQQYIFECIQSVIKQTFLNFELILLDDGSLDNSKDICEKMAAADERIRFESHKNIGASKTRKLGLELSRGEYVTFLDADDTIEENYLKKMYYAIRESNAEIVCCNSLDSGIENRAIEKNAIVSEKKFFLEAFLENKRYAYCIWGKLYKKSLFDNVVFPDMKYAEDTYVVMQVLQKASSVKLIEYYGYNYRDNLNGAMRSSKGIRQAQDVYCLYEYIYKCCQENYLQGIEKLQNKMVHNFFVLLINEKNCKEVERREIDVSLKKYQDIIPKKIYLYSLKGIIVYFYGKFPRIIKSILFLYKSVKG